MPNIYDQHRQAFANVSAYVIMRGGERIGTVAFKFPRDGAGRLYAYVHILGLPMQRGYASGGGYDKRSAAVEAACDKIRASMPKMLPEHAPDYMTDAHTICTVMRAQPAADWWQRIEGRSENTRHITGLYSVFQAV